VSLNVPENKPVGTLTERQRLALAAVLSAKSPEAATAPAIDAREGALTPA
jgi:hypothetical protein